MQLLPPSIARGQKETRRGAVGTAEGAETTAPAFRDETLPSCPPTKAVRSTYAMPLAPSQSSGTSMRKDGTKTIQAVVSEYSAGNSHPMTRILVTEHKNMRTHEMEASHL
eukprot:745615-Hanusia_phi.AAC.3